MQKKVIFTTCERYDVKVIKEHIFGMIKSDPSAMSVMKAGCRVLVKPNFLTAADPGKAVTTHPDVIAAVVEILTDYGVRPVIYDSPGVLPLRLVMSKSGVTDALKKYNVDIYEKDRTIDLHNKIPGGVFKVFKVSGVLDEVDAVINLPKLKTHGLLYMTLGVKNLFGLVRGTEKTMMHLKLKTKEALAQYIAELAMNVRPDITIVDGIVSMHKDGPSAGEPINTNIMAVSGDVFYLDHFLISCLAGDHKNMLTNIAYEKTTGGKLAGSYTIVAAGPNPFFENKFVFPKSVDPLLYKVFGGVLRPFLIKNLRWNEKDCARCDDCVNICAAKAIHFDKRGRLRFSKSRCINCLCCQEMCTRKAIEFR